MAGQQQQTGWTYKLIGKAPMGLCCTSCFCPCIIMGRTHERNMGNPNPGNCNMTCLGMCLACHVGMPCVCLGYERTKARDQFNIEGSFCKDVCCALACMPNVVMQSERESIARASGVNPVTNEPYKPVGAMSYDLPVVPPSYNQQPQQGA